MKKVKIKLNVALDGNEAGDVIEVDAHENGTPVLQFWRRRLRDAAFDDCCELVKAKKTTRKAASDEPDEQGD